ncbi:response regulator [candidate division KSB1 bacterium]|nr:response regulator [candidate division KSB1 bacterium]
MRIAVKKQVLIVDDDEHFRLSLAKILKKEGFEVWSAANGDEATKILEQHSFACVILDIRMPGKNSTELIREVKSRTRSAQVIIVTASHEAAIKEKALQAGADTFLLKPIKREEILAFARAARHA